MPEPRRQQLTMPAQPFLLEEVNLPPDLARAVAGQPVEVQVLPEELAETRPAEPDEFCVLFAPDGSRWNEYSPVRLTFTDSRGHSWRLPRRWLEGAGDPGRKEADSTYTVLQPLQFYERLHLPTFWDLVEINIPMNQAARVEGRPTGVSVCLDPREPIKVIWLDFGGVPWRIPHNWRRRRVLLPDRNRLMEQGVPYEVAETFEYRAVSVNYHPGSLCCLPDQYRFRDELGNRYPIYIRDCVLLGYGDADEHLA